MSLLKDSVTCRLEICQRLTNKDWDLAVVIWQNSVIYHWLMLFLSWSIYLIQRFMKTLKNQLWKNTTLQLMDFLNKFSYLALTNNILNLPMNNKEPLLMKNQNSMNMKLDCWTRWFKHSKLNPNQVKNDLLIFMILSMRILKLWTILKQESSWFQNIWIKKKSNILKTIVQNSLPKLKIEKPWSYGRWSLSNNTQKAKLKILDKMSANFAKELE